MILGHFRPLLGVKNVGFSIVFEGFRETSGFFSNSCLNAVSGRSWVGLGRSWAGLVAVLSGLGPLFGRSWTVLGWSWGGLGPVSG